MIYLDSAATSLLKPASVYKAYDYASRNLASPGRGAHTAAMKAADKVYECRVLLARLFNVNEPENIVFTFNATHALNIAIRSCISKNDKVVISGYEHNSVTRVLNDIGADVCVASSPLFDAEAAAEAFENNISGAKAVICNHVSNVFGFILPIENICRLAKEHGCVMIVDASQSAGVCSIDAMAFGADYIAMPGHKGLLGPQGTGVLVCGRNDTVPLILGGTGGDSKKQTMPDYLPDRLEAGTHNVPGIAGLAAGARYIMNTGAETIGKYEKRLCEICADKLSHIKELEVFGWDSENQSGVLSVRHKTTDTEKLCKMLSDAHIAVRGGMHCAPLAHKTAGTLDTGTVRLSFSPFLSENQVFSAMKTFEKILENNKN